MIEFADGFTLAWEYAATAKLIGFAWGCYSVYLVARFTWRVSCRSYDWLVKRGLGLLS